MGIPQPKRADDTPQIVTSSGKRNAIGGEGEVPDLRRMSFKRLLVFPCMGIPQSNLLSAPTRKRAPIRRESNRSDTARMPPQSLLNFPGASIPQLNRLVPTSSAGKCIPIRGEIEGGGRIVPVKDLLNFPGVSIPQPNGPIRTSTGECGSIRREGNRFDPAGMPPKSSLTFSSVSIP